MALSESDVVKQVRINLDEIGLNDSNFSGSQDEQELDTIIKQKIGSAVDYVLANASEEMAAESTLATSVADSNISREQIGSTGKYKRVCKIGQGVSRVLWARISSWTRAVSDFIYDTDPEYSMQSNALTMGTPERPVAAFSKRGTTNFSVELFTDTASTDSVDCYVLKLPGSVLATNGTALGYIPTSLESALLYYITGLVLLTLRDAHADNMFQQALVMMRAKSVQNN